MVDLSVRIETILHNDHDCSPINTNYARIYGGPSFLDPDQR